MKAIVTGATGFVGSNLVKELLDQGNQVTVIIRNKNKVSSEWTGRVQIIEASNDQYCKLMAEAFHEEKYDTFYHLAWGGTSGMDRADVSLQLNNVKYTCDAVELAVKLGCDRFVNAGSIMEYEVMQFIPGDGNQPGMGNIYSTAKLTADFMAKTVATKAHISYQNIIISNIYGAGEKSARFINTTLRKMMRNESIPLTHGQQLYDFIYVTDAVKAIALVGKTGERNMTYYIGSGDVIPLKEYIVRMKDTIHSKSELLFGEVPFSGARLTYKEFDTARLASLGFVAEHSFEEGIELTWKWMQEEENEF